MTKIELENEFIGLNPCCNGIYLIIEGKVIEVTEVTPS